MKTKLVLYILTAVCCLSLAVSQESHTIIGVGVSLNPTALFSTSTSSTLFLPVGFTNIYIPIMVSANFRIEPEAGIYSLSSENTSGSFTSKSTSTMLRLGVGLLYVFSSESSFSSYVGPRLGILSNSSTSSSTGSSELKTSETDFFIGLCVGGEHSFSAHFSIGGEVQMNYISFGEPDRTPAQPTTSTRTQSAFTNNALMFFRWYF
jgi:hypothetical protein